jgi:hypothetical protein
VQVVLFLVAMLGPPVEAPGTSRPPVQVPKARIRPAPELADSAPPAEPMIEPPPPVIAIGDDDLPSWDEAPLRSPPPAANVPRDGGGAITVGSLMLIAGAGLAAGSIVTGTDPYLRGEVPLSLGTALVGGAGIGVLAAGVRTRKKFRATELGQLESGPPTGRALHGGAAVAMTTGSVTLLTGILLWTKPCYECDEPSSEGLALLAAGPGLLMAGSIMLIVSMVRRTKYRNWSNRRSATIQPSFGFGPNAMHVGWSGRF